MAYSVTTEELEIFWQPQPQHTHTHTHHPQYPRNTTPFTPKSHVHRHRRRGQNQVVMQLVKDTHDGDPKKVVKHVMTRLGKRNQEDSQVKNSK